MKLISLLTVSGKYINNVGYEFARGREINFWLNPYHKSKLKGINKGDIIAIFLSGEGLMFLGELVDFPTTNTFYGEHTISDTYKTFKTIGFGRLGLDPNTNNALNDFVNLINNVFSASNIFIPGDKIISLMIKPFSHSRYHNMGIYTDDGQFKAVPLIKIEYDSKNNSKTDEVEVTMNGKKIKIPVPKRKPIEVRDI